MQPSIKIIVYSVEDKPFRIKSLFDKCHISGYVFKGRNSIQQLKLAMQAIYNTKERYSSPELAAALTDKSASEIDNYDIEVLKLMAQGLKQEALAAGLKLRILRRTA